MFTAIALLIVCAATGAFMCTRVYMLLVRGELNVKGALYSREATPVQYWLVFAMAIIGTTFALLMAVVIGVGLIE